MNVELSPKVPSPLEEFSLISPASRVVSPLPEDQVDVAKPSIDGLISKCISKENSQMRKAEKQKQKLQFQTHILNKSSIPGLDTTRNTAITKEKKSMDSAHTEHINVVGWHENDE